MAHRYRLTATPEEEAALRGHCAHARFVWNLAVEQQSWWRPGRGSAPGAAARWPVLRPRENLAGKPSCRSRRGAQGLVIRDVRAKQVAAVRAGGADR